MSKGHSLSPKRIRLPYLLNAKREGRKLAMLTAYDALTAPLFEAAGVDMLLVGDSLGNVMLGFDGTLNVSLENMVTATGAVARSTSRAFVVADLPFGTYEADRVTAFNSAVQLVKAGAHAVKIEGPRPQIVETLVEGGIAVMGHLGYTPQAEHALGGPRLQGKGQEPGAQLLAQAKELEQAGVFAIVLEMVPATLAQQITEALTIPTIGIGAGPDCDGQVLVWSDMAGMTDWTPSFVRRFGELGRELKACATDYVEAVADGTFPGPEQTRD